MRFLPCASIWLFIAISGACAGHRPVHHAPDESQPHISWDVRSGGGDGEARLICSSSQPKPSCVLDRGSAERRTFVTLHFYLHPAARPVKYEGSITVPFVGEVAAPRPVSVSVQPGQPPGSITISGLVPQKASEYKLAVALVASADSGEPVKIVVTVPVVLR